MAGTYQDWFDLFSNADQSQDYQRRAQAHQRTKQSQVDEASRKKQEELRRITDPRNASQIVASQASDDGFDSASEMEQDFRTMSGFELTTKYGNEVGNQLLGARTRAGLGYTDAMSQERGAGTIVADSALGAGKAFVRGFGGLASWGLGELDADAGVTAAKFTNTVSDFLGSAIFKVADIDLADDLKANVV